MTSLQFILGNINIVLESLPISSSGHMKLILHKVAQKTGTAPEKIDSTTEHLMHIPNIFVISTFLLYLARSYTIEISSNELLTLFLAFCITNTITGTIYLISKKRRMAYIPLSWGFIFSGCTLLSVYAITYGTLTTITPYQAAIIGLAQTLALLPGVSRLAMTCVSALWLGIDPILSLFFSLICELGLIIVANVVTVIPAKEIYNNTLINLLTSRSFLVSIIASSLLSLGALGVTLHALLTKNIVFFGWYLLLLGSYLLVKALQNTSKDKITRV